MVIGAQGAPAGAVRLLAVAVTLPASIQTLVLLLSWLGADVDRLTASLVLVTAGLVSAAVARAQNGDGGRGISSEPPSPLALRCLAVALVLWSLSSWIRQVLLAWQRPVYDWDGLYYHVPALHGWVQAERVVWIEGLHDLPFANGYPLGLETLGLWLHALVATSRLVDAGNLLLWPLGAVGLWIIAAEFGATGPGRWIAAAALPIAPAFVVLATTCYVEPALASGVASLVATCLLWRRRPGPRRAALVGLAAGLVLALKGLGWPLAALVLAGAFGSALRSGMGRREALLQTALVLTLAALVGGGWPARSLMHTGNPFHPISIELAGRTWIDGYDPHEMVRSNLPPELADWPPVLQTLRAWVPNGWQLPSSDAIGGMGLVWVLGGLPLVAWGTLRGPRRRLGLPRWPAVAFLLMLVVQPGPWWARFTLWLHALGLPAVGRALEASTRKRRWLAGLLALVLCSGVVESERTLDAQRALGRADGTPGGRYVPTVERCFPGLVEQEGFARLWEEPIVGRSRWSRLGTLLGGALSLPLERRRLVVLPTDPTAEDVDALRARGVEWVLWDQGGGGPLPPPLVATASAIHRYQRGADIDFLAVRLGPRP